MAKKKFKHNAEPVKWVETISSHIHSFGYEPQNSVLHIKFIGGEHWAYHPITSVGYNEFLKAGSKGQVFHRSIKNNKNVEALRISD